MQERGKWFRKGIENGIPIALGYLCVSFTLGIASQKVGMNVLQATMMSFFNNASAGEFAAISVIGAGASYAEMAVTELIVNLRYILMSCALSQKLDENLPFIHRLLIAFDVTDEIFGVSVSVDGKLNPYYNYGMMAVALPGWAIGTGLGVVCGDLMPARLLSAMSVALYGMFLSIIIPPAKKNKVIAVMVIAAMIASGIFAYAPALRQISSGFRIIILTVCIAGIAAVLFPIPEEEQG